MNNDKTTIKIADDMLAEIKMLQNKFTETIQQLGLLGVEKIDLDRAVTDFVEKEKKLKEEWGSLQKLEQGLLDRISKTYGEGSLNMNDGTFAPSIK